MISVIHTGGTIASAQTTAGFAPQTTPGFYHLVERCADLLGIAVVQQQLQNADGQTVDLQDSCTIGAASWRVLNQHIERLCETSQAVVVLHGTDTMAYTASALSLLAPRRSISTVLTGAQIPWQEPNSDAANNIRLALAAAAGHYGDPQGDTLIAFDQRLMRGIRASKFSSRRQDAFYAPGATTSTDAIDLGATREQGINHFQQQRPNLTGLAPVTQFSTQVMSVNITPDMPLEWLSILGKTTTPGALLLNLFGLGSAPDARALVQVCNDLSAAGWLLMGRSICSDGGVDWQVYEATAAFRDSVLICGRDISHEAGIVKLRAALCQPTPKHWIAQNVAGEWTI